MDPAGTPVETTLTARSAQHEVTRGWPKLTRGPAVLEGVFPDTWEVRLWAIGYRFHGEQVVLSSDTDALTFALEPIEPVRGRVLDPEGRPAAGARILEGYGRGREARAASDGTFELAAMPCRLHLTATLPVFGCEDGLTASDGTFALVDLPSGSHSLWVTRPDGTKAGPFFLDVSAGGANALEIRLPVTQ